MAIDREKVLQSAQKHIEKRRYDRAIADLQRLLGEQPNDARLLLRIGDLQAKMGAFPDAIATYERVGRLYATGGFALKAIAVFKQIRELIARQAPQLADRYAYIAPQLADLYQQLGLTSDALATLSEFAHNLETQGRKAEALEVYRKTVELDTHNPLPHLHLAEALSRSGEIDGAVAEYAVAAAQLVRGERRDDALKVIERLLQHRADTAHARIAAELYLQRRQANDGMLSLAKLQVCFQANPKDLRTLELLAEAFTLIGQASKSVEVKKEMARIAREQGDDALLDSLTTELARIAPHDDFVIELLEAQRAPPREPEPPYANAMAPPESAMQQAPSYAPPNSYRPSDDYAQPSSAPVGSAPEIEVAEHVAAARDDFPSDENIELIDDADLLEETGSTDAVGAIVEHARELRARGSFDAAVEQYHTATDLSPRDVAIRTELRDVLIELGRTDEAIEEMLLVASIQLEALDGEAAARTLEHVLIIDPSNQRAIVTLRELGYEVEEPPPAPPPAAYAEHDRLPAYAYDDASAQRTDTDGQPYGEHAAPYEPQSAGYSDPGYADTGYADTGYADTGYADAGYADTGYADTGYGRQGEPTKPPAASATAPPPPSLPNLTHQSTSDAALEVIDDPFAGEGPLPSFPLPAAETESAFELVPSSREPQPLAPSEPYGSPSSGRRFDDATAVDPSAAPSSSSLAGAPSPAPANIELEEALEEADFFASRGLFDDARAILSEQLERVPNHPLLVERLSELEEQERAAGQSSGTRALPQDHTDRSFDIAASLDALESLDDKTEIDAQPHQQVDVEEVFAKFKEGVAQTLSVDDSQSHYDLGVAYKEMGLLDDAIREFEIAARDPVRTCVCESMIGGVHLDRGDISEGIEALLRALHAAHKTAEQETAISFDLGFAYEQTRMFRDALTYYRRVARREPNFRDVQDRIRRLANVESIHPQRAVGADEEFERAFDEIIGSSKLP